MRKSALALLCAVLTGFISAPWAHADAIGPDATVLVGTPNRAFAGSPVTFDAVSNGAVLRPCFTRGNQKLYEPTFLVSANDTADGLGALVFDQTTRIGYIWNFGTGTVANSLALFSNKPTATFTGDTTISVMILDKVGNSTRMNFSVRFRDCTIS